MKLKKCPWCGKRPKVENSCDGWTVSCNIDRCRMAPYTPPMETRKEAIDTWNHRYV
jgi:sarcosine oxidase delta subunit